MFIADESREIMVENMRTVFVFRRDAHVLHFKVTEAAGSEIKNAKNSRERSTLTITYRIKTQTFFIHVA